MDLILYSIIFFISIIQSVAGVGILVLGTPIMLILNYSILDTMLFLLPISIISSFCNFLLINFSFKEKKNIDWKLLKHFFIICFPAVCIGLLIIKNYENFINFNILVSLIIIFSIIIKINSDKFIPKLKTYQKNIFTFFIGFIHGLTNSGGTLLSLFFITKDKKQINNSRLQIHFFYLFLALTQFIFLFFLVDNELKYSINFFFVLLIILISCFIGNIVIKINEILVLYLIYILACISSAILLIKGIL